MSTTIADVKVGDKWLTADFGWYFNDKKISPPVVKTNFIEIPGTSDVIDLTSASSGDVEFQQREITITLISADGKDSYYSKFSELANYIHGKRLPLIFSVDSGYYWIGRIEVTQADPIWYGQTVILKATVDPYKYETHEGSTVRDYTNKPTPGSVTIIGGRKRICPTITCSTPMSVTYNGNTYSLIAGKNQNENLFLGEGNHVLSFTGSVGTVTIDYVGGSL